MIDSFPFDEWSEDIVEFWTFGGQNSTGTYIMTALAVTAMLLALIGFVVLEKRKLERQAARLRASGVLDRPAVSTVTVTTTTITTDPNA